jgi:hypothetical protein
MGEVGRGIIAASWLGTAVFVIVAIGAAVAPDSLGATAALVDVILFLAGVVVFLWAYGVAVGRSRTDLMGIGGLFFLAGSAPRAVQVRLLVPLGIEVAVGIMTASVRLYSPLAFGILVPMYGLGLAGLWGARHGSFPPRPVSNEHLEGEQR